MRKNLALIPIAVLLAACGGGNGDLADTAPAIQPTQTAPMPADAFTGKVNATAGASSETAEPAAVDAAVSSPEETEPSAIS